MAALCAVLSPTGACLFPPAARSPLPCPTTSFFAHPAGNLVGLLLSPLILQHFGWRALFYIFGLVGAPLLLAWAALVPSQASKVSGSAAAAAAGGSGGGGSKVGVAQLLSKPATWAIIVTNFGELVRQEWPCTGARWLRGFQAGAPATGQAHAVLLTAFRTSSSPASSACSPSSRPALLPSRPPCFS